MYISTLLHIRTSICYIHVHVPQPSVYVHVSQEECKPCLNTTAIGTDAHSKMQHPHGNQVSLKLANPRGGKLDKGILPCMVANKSHNTSPWEEKVFNTGSLHTLPSIILTVYC